MPPRATPRSAKTRTIQICRRTMPRPRALVSADDGSWATLGASSDGTKYASRFASSMVTSNADGAMRVLSGKQYGVGLEVRDESELSRCPSLRPLHVY